MKQKTIKRKKKESKSNALLFFSCFFSTNFRLANRMVGQEDADRCEEEDTKFDKSPKWKKKTRAQGGRWKTKEKERKVEVSDRQNLLDRREALQMWSETRHHDHRQKNTTVQSVQSAYVFRRRVRGIRNLESDNNWSYYY